MSSLKQKQKVFFKEWVMENKSAYGEYLHNSIILLYYY